MPYFIDDKQCVRKGTKEDPGEVVKCHDDHKSAVAHLRALYVNVEDADKVFVEVEGEMFEFEKGSASSGWHKPPRGTHTAENAPNFAGGPGADRKYGTESDEPPDKTRRCKCKKCGAVVILPKGKQCEDVKCPSCKGGMQATEWREDKPAEGRGGRKPKPGQTKAQETHPCTCPECGKSVHVPLGQKCNEVKCPDCKAMMKQGDSGQDKQVDCPACEEEKAAMAAPGPTVHGEGGSLGEVSSVGDSDGTCKCPNCGKPLPCTAKACPYCKKSIDKVERGEGDSEKRATKSEGDGQHPAGHYLVVEDPEKPTTWHLRVRNAKGDLDHTLMGGAWAALHGGYRGNKYEGPSKAEALAKLKKLYAQEGMDTPSEKGLTIYKSDDGTWRWITHSNWAIIDREIELISEQAYRDGIAYAQKSGSWGELDLVHVGGTDVGDCDTLFISKQGSHPPRLGAGGTWYDTAMATRAREAIQADPERWGVSLKFRFDPARRVHGIYTGGIQILKHSILPQHMAASYGTAIAVRGGESMSKQIDEKTAAALRDLNVTEEEIVELAQKQKAAPVEENVVEKEDTTEAGGLKGLWQALGKMFAPDASTPAEAGKATEAEPVQEAVEQPAEKAEGEPDASEIVKAVAQAVAGPLGELVKKELDARDALIAELQEAVKALSVDVETKVEQRLADVPPVVTASPTMVGALAAPGQQDTKQKTFVGSLMKDILQASEDTYGGKKYQT